MYFLDKASISKPFRTSCFKTAAFQVFDAHLVGLDYWDQNLQIVNIFRTIDH